jgi:Ni,Fe-hydrogenase maturation factor
MRRLFLCLGSEYAGDDLALEVCDALKGKIKNADFLKCEDPFEIPDHVKSEGKVAGDVVIIDVVRGLGRARIFDGVDEFEKTRSVSAHDLDACTVLKLLESMEDRRFRIIGIPMGPDKARIAEDVMKLISSL